MLRAARKRVHETVIIRAWSVREFARMGGNDGEIVTKLEPNRGFNYGNITKDNAIRQCTANRAEREVVVEDCRDVGVFIACVHAGRGRHCSRGLYARIHQRVLFHARHG